MDFIDYSTALQQPIPYQKYLKHTTNQNNIYIVSPSTNSFSEIKCHLEKSESIQIISSIKMSKQLKYICIRIFFWRSDISLNLNRLKKTFLVRIFLRMNLQYTNFHFNFNPNSGEFNLSFIMFSTFQQFNTCQTIQLLIQQLLTQFNIQVLKEYKKIYCFLSSQEFQLSQKTQQHSFIQKRFLIASKFYSWNVLQGTTFSKKEKKDPYIQTKSKFINMKKFYKQNQSINQISKVYKELITQNSSPLQLTNTQDNQIRDKYLEKRLVINRNSKQMNEITITRDALQFLIRKGQAKINTTQLAMIKISCKKFRQQDIPRLKYQRKIIEKLPNPEYIGISKYYYIKNFQNQTQQYIFTNLINTKHYYQYILANSTTISYYTYISIFHQLATSLKHLRDSGIVYHNLIKKNIEVKKGLGIIIKDFSNAYHQNVESLDNNLRKNILPSVINMRVGSFRTHDDERSDVFSFGNFLYESMFGNTPHGMRQSYLRKKQNQQQILNKLQMYPIMAIQKCSWIGYQFLNEIFYLLLMAIDYKRQFIKQKSNENVQIQKSQDRFKKKKIKLQNRPYLDWMVLIITSKSQYLHSLC